MIIAKARLESHFTRDFGGGAFSHRVILPGPDQCRVKVTRFIAPPGFMAQDIKYDTDETVFVVSGSIRLVCDGVTRDLVTGECYHVPAGEAYDVEVKEPSVLICFFSQAGPAGPLPDNN